MLAKIEALYFDGPHV